MSLAARRNKHSKIANEIPDIALKQLSPSRRPLHNNFVNTKTTKYKTLKNPSRKSIDLQPNRSGLEPKKSGTLHTPDAILFNRGSRQQNTHSQQGRRYEADDSLRKSCKNERYDYSQEHRHEYSQEHKPINRYSGTAASQKAYLRGERQPQSRTRSSLSQQRSSKQERGESQERRISVIHEQRNYVLEDAKLEFKKNNYAKAIEILQKYTKFNRSCIEARYYLGMSLINNADFQPGIHELQETLHLDPYYKKTLYLIIALAYKKLNLIHEAVHSLTKGIKVYPDYYDCWVYRAKMLMKLERYAEAIQDFSKAISLNPTKGFAYLGKGTAERVSGMLNDAMQTFTLGLETDLAEVCLEKRAQCCYDLDRFEDAIRDIERFKKSGRDSAGCLHHIKGMCYYRLSKPIEAILCFEESLKHDTVQSNVTASVEMMLQIKIEEKDFYEAQHILDRIVNVEVDKDAISEWRIFVEAALLLMKKKYKEGAAMFEKLLAMPLYKLEYKHIAGDRERERFKFIKPLAHLYKAFGELARDCEQDAKRDYEEYDHLVELLGLEGEKNTSRVYNSLIMEAKQKFPHQCRALIQEASNLIPTKPEPYLFLAFERVQSSLKTVPVSSMSVKKQEDISFVLECIEEGISHLPQLSTNHISSFYFYRAVIYLYSQDYKSSVEAIEKAIEKSEDNISKYFYVRGLIFSLLGNFSQAIQDYSIAIKLDDRYSDAYLERAKCLQLEGNTGEAFKDLQKYIKLNPSDPYVHKYAGILLFQNCSYQDCLEALSHGNVILDDETLLTKAKCHFLLNNNLECLTLFRKLALQSSSDLYKNDVEMIKICCQQITESSTKLSYEKNLASIEAIIESIIDEEIQCKIFKVRDFHQVRGSIYLLMGMYEPCIAEFKLALKYFRQEKRKEIEKQYIEDPQVFEDEWSEAEIKFNIALCALAAKDYEQALFLLHEFKDSSERGEKWEQFVELVESLRDGKISQYRTIEMDVFEQGHRISKNWPRLKLPGTEVYVSLAFSYPYVQPPEMNPEFDMKLLEQFHMKNAESKPEAPWINRQQKCLVFTPNIQAFQNLELSVTTAKKNDSSKRLHEEDICDSYDSHIPASNRDKSIHFSGEQIRLEGDKLRMNFMLDPNVEMRLQKLMKKKQERPADA